MVQSQLLGRQFQQISGYDDRQNLQATSNIEIDEEIIKRTDKLKLLRVTIDEWLNFSDHVSATCKKTSKLIGVLMRLKKLIPTGRG